MTAGLVAAWSGLFLAVWLTGFQLLLALGAPFGHLAWGGRDRGRLPRRKRIASAVAAGAMALIAAAYGQAADLWSAFSQTVSFWIFGGTAALFAISFVGNLATSSTAERWHGVPATAVLTLSSLVLVLA